MSAEWSSWFHGRPCSKGSATVTTAPMHGTRRVSSGPLGSPPVPLPLTPAVVELAEVSVRRGTAALLREVNWTVRAGERWVLLGPNGAGKTTLLSLAGALIHPSEGAVTVLGARFGRADLRELRRRIGHVDPRRGPAGALPVHEVVLTGATGTALPMPRWVPSPAVERAAEELEREFGVEELRDRRWSTLSAGEAGRALVARALLAHPDLLVLDEPFTGLDVGGRERLVAALDRLAELRPELASVLVTHHLEEVPGSSTHVALLSGGRLLSAGSTEEVLRDDALSSCFATPLAVERRGDRWTAAAPREPVVGAAAR